MQAVKITSTETNAQLLDREERPVMQVSLQESSRQGSQIQQLV